jgi:hypothetical protein
LKHSPIARKTEAFAFSEAVNKSKRRDCGRASSKTGMHLREVRHRDYFNGFGAK